MLLMIAAPVLFWADILLPLGVCGGFILGVWILVRREQKTAPSTRLVGLLNLSILVAMSLLTALLTLVVQDWLSKGTITSMRRFCWTLGVLLALIVLAILRTRRQKKIGTLYYVRYLEPGMKDWHLNNLRGRQGAQLDVRALTRHMLARKVDGVRDVADEVYELGCEFQDLVAGDDSATANNMALNLLYPAGLSFGYDLLAWQGMVFEELNEYETSERVSWRVDDRPNGAPDEERSVRADEPSEADDVRVVWVSLDMGEGADEPQLRYDLHRSLTYLLPEAGDGDRPSRVSAHQRRVTVTTECKPDEAWVHPWSMIRDCTALLRDTLHEYPDAMIIVTARLTKIVGVGIGMELATPSDPDDPTKPKADRKDPGCGHSGCQNASCRNPWSRLVPLMNDQTPGANRYLIARVHPAQPSARELRAALIPRPAPTQGHRVVNLTPHDVTLYRGDTRIVTWPADGQIARLDEKRSAADDLTITGHTVPVSGVRYRDDVIGLPEPQEDTVYLTSRVLAAAVDRADVVFPFPEKRDPSGRILGCEGLGRFVTG